ncbi:GNAT family N-acetyltransferase [Streptomyces erythrogriseus]
MTTPAERTEHIIAMTNVMRTGQRGVGELAILIEDTWQARGLGTALAEHATTVARRDGHHALAATVTASNKPMLHLLKKLNASPSKPPVPCTTSASCSRPWRAGPAIARMTRLLRGEGLDQLLAEYATAQGRR